MKQPSRRIKIIISCCLVATAALLYQAQHTFDSSSQRQFSQAKHHNYSQVIHETRLDDDIRWTDLSWEELVEEVRAAAMKLGLVYMKLNNILMCAWH
jgi:hypothetical protein